MNQLYEYTSLILDFAQDVRASIWEIKQRIHKYAAAQRSEINLRSLSANHKGNGDSDVSHCLINCTSVASRAGLQSTQDGGELFIRNNAWYSTPHL